MEKDKTSVDLNGYENGYEMNSEPNANTVENASDKPAAKIGVGAAVGIGVGAAMVGAGAVAVPFFAFARGDGADPAQEDAQAAENVSSQTVDDGTAQTEGNVNAGVEGTMDVASVAESGHVAVASDLTLAGNVTDDMTFSEAFAAARALDANIFATFSDGNHLVSFDTVVEVMKQTGHDLPSLYKETSQGGLAKEFVEEEGEKRQ